MRETGDAGEGRIACAGAVVIVEGRLLVIRRGHPPGLGHWSIPGGRLEPGETAAQAAAREVREETGLVVEIGEQLGRADIDGDDGVGYSVTNFAATAVGGTLGLVAGSDATEARFVPMTELAAFGLAPSLLSWLGRDGRIPGLG